MAAVVVLALAGLVLGFGVLGREASPPASPVGSSPAREALRKLAAAASHRHRVEGRLSTLPWTPGSDRREPAARFRGPAPDPDPDEQALLLEAGEEIQRALRTEKGPLAVQALATYLLMEGHPERAVPALEMLAAAPNPTPEVLADLTTAYTERARLDGRDHDLVLALQAADRAVALAPDASETRYARAFALDNLHLSHQATAAWEAFLEVDPSSPWADEARRRLAILAQPTDSERWLTEKQRLLTAARAGDLETVQTLTRDFPARVRDLVLEETLPSWARSIADGRPEEASELLRAAHLLAAAVAVISDDDLALTQVEITEQAASSGPAAVSGAVTGLEAFGTALERYNAQDIEPAREAFLAARSSFAAIGAPLAVWTAYYIAACDHYKDPALARPGLETTLAIASRHSWPGLRARAQRLLGIGFVIDGSLGASLEHYRAARRDLDSSGDRKGVGFLDLLQAEGYSRLGDTGRSWRLRLSALSAMARAGDPRWLHATLVDTIEALLRQNEADLAMPFARELLDNQASWGNQLALAEALLQQGRIEAQTGRPEDAVATLRRAEELVRNGSSNALTDRITSQLRMAEGEAAVARDPAAAVSALTQAIDQQSLLGYAYQRTHLLTLRARAHRLLGDEAPARADLDRAIREFERLRAEPDREELRESLFGLSQGAFDQMVDLQATAGDADGAFRYAERSRARALLDRFALHTTSPPAPPESLSAVAAALPERAGLIEYAVLPDRLLIWWIAGGRADMVAVDISAGELDRRVQRLRSALEGLLPEESVRAAATDLYSLLLAPVASRLDGVSMVVVVPDRMLHRVPFPALFDPERGRYVIDEHAVVTEPSAASFLAALDSDRRFPRNETPSLAALGDPELPADSPLGGQPLPGARDEAPEVAALYPTSEVLVGESATPSRLLEALARYRIVHFAGHGTADDGPGGAGRLFLASEPTAPDGVLSARDVASRQIDATEIVVLSACESAGTPGTGREAPHGLATAFLAAGVPTVVASLWKADDDASRDLMLTFHRGLVAGLDPATALQRAQQTLLHTASPHANPAYWAAFAVTGASLPEPEGERNPL